jgi:hypothetical protein
MATPLDNLAERNRLVEDALTNYAKLFPYGKIIWGQVYPLIATWPKNVV